MDATDYFTFPANAVGKEWKLTDECKLNSGVRIRTGDHYVWTRPVIASFSQVFENNLLCLT